MTLITELQLGKLNQTIFQMDELSGVMTTYEAPLVSLGQKLCQLYYDKDVANIILKGSKKLSYKVADDIEKCSSTLYSDHRDINITIV